MKIVALACLLAVAAVCNSDLGVIGTDISTLEAATVVGGEDCGSSFGTVTVNCSDDDNTGVNCNNEEVLCSTDSNEAMGVTGTGSREEKTDIDYDCIVCTTVSCATYNHISETKAAACSGD